MAPKITAPCGTRSAWVRHKRKGEQPCEECRLAYNEYCRAYYSRRRSSRPAATTEQAPTPA